MLTVCMVFFYPFPFNVYFLLYLNYISYKWPIVEACLLYTLTISAFWLEHLAHLYFLLTTTKNFITFGNFLVIISSNSFSVPIIYILASLKLSHSSPMLCPLFFLYFFSQFSYFILDSFCCHIFKFINLFSYSV